MSLHATRGDRASPATVTSRLAGHAPLLPGQEASQYLSVSDASIEGLAHALFAPGVPPPHLLLASFSLQYLERAKRRAFFDLLATLTKRPMLVLVIKGVGAPPLPHLTSPLLCRADCTAASRCHAPLRRIASAAAPRSAAS